jgi:hypothetical protein
LDLIRLFKETEMSRLMMASSVTALAALVLTSSPAARAQYIEPDTRGTVTFPSYYGGGYYSPNAQYSNLSRGSRWYYDYYGTGRSRFRSGPGQYQEQGTQQVSGQILRTKRVEVPEQNIEVLAALVETEDGRRQVVDLGPIEDLQDQGIRCQSGDEIRARGRFVRIGDHLVLLAQRLNADGQTVRIQQQIPSQLALLRRGERLRGNRPQDTEDLEENQAGSRRSFYYQPEDEAGRQQLTGRIQQTRQVQLPGIDQKLLVAQVRTDQGQKYIIWFGPADETQSIDLNRGDRVAVSGPTLQTSEGRMMLAQRVRAHGETARIRQLGQEEIQPYSTRVRGEITRTKTIRLPGIDQDVLVAQVRTDQGRRYTVCLGPADQIDNIDLDRGDEISLRGKSFPIDGQRFLLAEQVRIHGQTVNLQD